MTRFLGPTISTDTTDVCHSRAASKALPAWERTAAASPRNDAVSKFLSRTENACREGVAMSQPFKICLSGCSIVCLMLAGCAGGGLKNMFSRDDTAGYRTLEEIEAEEAGKPLDKSEVADATPDDDKPRFASWLPFGKKEEAETKDLLAEAETRADTEVESSKYGKWWQRPFKTRDPYESDPFLADADETTKTDDDVKSDSKDAKKPSTRTVASSTETDTEKIPAIQAAESKSKAGSNEVASSTKKDSSVRPVSGSKTLDESKTEPADDALLVEKFEEHFRKDTLEAAEQADEAEPLIVAGKTAAEKTTRDAKSRVQKTSDEKLNELEQLLADRRTTAVKAREQQAKAESKVSTQATKTETAAEDLFATASKAEAGVRKKSSDVARTAEKELSSFDRLLMEANGELPVPEKSRTTTVASKPSTKSASSTKSKTASTEDVRVASAEDLFGTESSRSESSSRKTKSKTKSASTSFSASDGFDWHQSERDDAMAPSAPQKEAIARTIVFEESRPPRTNSDMAPAPLNDTPEMVRDRAVAKTNAGSAKTRSSGSPFRTVSSARLVDGDNGDGARTATSSKSGSSFEGDGFFTQGPLEVPPALAKARVSADAKSDVASNTSASRFQMTGRHWMLLIGGLIVVALLFAPGGKKHLSAGPGPVQG